ncbi:hypothetical protein J4558_10575 [Leptolyngbya sp. 15MV]|nr:hypothetical protein J4558_10575 [Leptolyngbya sp. 15MV]
MTVPEHSERAASPVGSIVLLVAASTIVLFALAFIAGMLVAASDSEGPHSLLFFAILGGVALIGAGAAWVIVRNREVMRLPASPRMRNSRVMLYACLAVGVVTGAGLAITEGPESADLGTLFSTPAPISSTTALLLVGLFLLATALSARWHLLLDEHERAAYDFGAVAALYLYFVVSTCWWLLARGELAPPPDGYVIFWLVMFAWMIGWVIRRYR